MNRGFVQVYTGNGKGKTTAAFGLAIRASAYGRKIYIAQLMKGMPYGENIYLKNDANIMIEQFGWKECIRKSEVSEFHKKIIREGFEVCLERITNSKYDIVILDEIITTVYFDLISEKDLFTLIDKKPSGSELILTGRYASEELISRADLVTQMNEIKHPFQKGVSAREGIEF